MGKYELDERLRLTDEQKAAVSKYNEAVEAMKKSGVICVCRTYGELGVFNGNLVSDYGFVEDAIDDDIIVPFMSLDAVNCPFGLELTMSDTYFSVMMKE